MSHSPAPARRRFFLDTEFIDIGTAIVPISVGVVTEEGRQFYVEIESAWRDHADDWTWSQSIWAKHPCFARSSYARP